MASATTFEKKEKEINVKKPLTIAKEENQYKQIQNESWFTVRDLM